MKSYIVIGLGRFGTEVARQLCLLGCEVLAVDSRSELVQQISGDVTHAVVADARDKDVLKAQWWPSAVAWQILCWQP